MIYPGGTRNTALKIGTVMPKSGRLGSVAYRLIITRIIWVVIKISFTIMTTHHWKARLVLIPKKLCMLNILRQ